MSELESPHRNGIVNEEPDLSFPTVRTDESGELDGELVLSKGTEWERVVRAFYRSDEHVVVARREYAYDVLEGTESLVCEAVESFVLAEDGETVVHADLHWETWAQQLHAESPSDARASPKKQLS